MQSETSGQQSEETLKNKLEKLEAEQRKLVLGQIAFLADEAILVYVVENPGYLYYHSDKEMVREVKKMHSLMKRERESMREMGQVIVKVQNGGIG